MAEPEIPLGEPWPYLEFRRAEVERTRKALNATKWWQPKRWDAADRYKEALWLAACAESDEKYRVKIKAARENALSDMTRWVERLLNHEDGAGFDQEIGKMSIEDIAEQLLAIGRKS